MKFSRFVFVAPGVHIGTRIEGAVQAPDWELWDETKGPWVFLRRKGGGETLAVPRAKVECATVADGAANAAAA